MADHIPFITSEDGANLVRSFYLDSSIFRIALDRAPKLHPLLPPRVKVWLDPSVDGMDDLRPRRSIPRRKNPWFEFMQVLPNFESIATPAYQANPDAAEVYAFVEAVMDKCNAYKPAWITIPQLPLVSGSGRNKINRELAKATSNWKRAREFSGSLILPLVFTHQRQVRGKTERNPQVKQAIRCYDAAQADGYWVVESSLDDESGASTLRKRCSSVIDLHEELDASVPSRIRVAGPYWGLNLVLWARNLVDYLAIGIGTGYQYRLAGSPASPSSKNRLMLAPLRRRVEAKAQITRWLESAAAGLAPSHLAHVEFRDIKNRYAALRGQDAAKTQVAELYRQWLDTIAGVPKAGRSMALFQDLSAAFALGKFLPDLPEPGPARRPEAVAEPLMLSCL
jgi:hypothetical protein